MMINGNINVKKLKLEEIGEEHVIAFLKSVARGMQQGVSLQKAIFNTKQGESNRKREALYEDIYQKARRGNTPLFKILDSYPKVFKKKLVLYIGAGEKSGSTHIAIDEALKNLEIEKGIKKRILKSSTLPILYFFTSFGLWIAAVVFIFPATYSLIHESHGVAIIEKFDQREHMAYVVGYIFNLLFLSVIGVGILIGYMSFSRNKQLERVLYAIPIIGYFFLNLRRYFTFKNLSSLVKSGGDISSSIKSLIPFTYYEIFKIELQNISSAIKKGKKNIWFEGYLISSIDRIELNGAYSSQDVQKILEDSSNRAYDSADRTIKVFLRVANLITLTTAMITIFLLIYFTILFNYEYMNEIKRIAQ